VNSIPTPDGLLYFKHHRANRGSFKIKCGGNFLAKIPSSSPRVPWMKNMKKERENNVKGKGGKKKATRKLRFERVK
jgi:hypothetical protein